MELDRIQQLYGRNSCEIQVEFQFHSGEVVRVDQLEHGWDGECIPYGGDGNTRLGALLTANAWVVGPAESRSHTNAGLGTGLTTRRLP